MHVLSSTVYSLREEALLQLLPSQNTRLNQIKAEVTFKFLDNTAMQNKWSPAVNQSHTHVPDN